LEKDNKKAASLIEKQLLSTLIGQPFVIDISGFYFLKTSRHSSLRQVVK
jgi:hypothetical protein